MLVRDSRLHVVNAFHIGDIGTEACICQLPALTEGLRLEVRSQIVIGVRARVIVKLISPHKATERKQRRGTDQARPSGCNVEGPDLGALIRRPQRIADHRIKNRCACSIASKSYSGELSAVAWVKLLIERIGSLKPGTRVADVQVDGILWGKLVVNAVEHVLFVAFGVRHGELWRIQEPAGVQAVQRKEGPPLRYPISEVESRAGGAETAVGRGHVAHWRGYSQSRFRRNFDDQARLSAKLRWRRARDDLQRLNGVGGYLVGKYLALLIRDRLAVHGKRV